MSFFLSILEETSFIFIFLLYCKRKRQNTKFRICSMIKGDRELFKMSCICEYVILVPTGTFQGTISGYTVEPSLVFVSRVIPPEKTFRDEQFQFQYRQYLACCYCNVFTKDTNGAVYTDLMLHLGVVGCGM